MGNVVINCILVVASFVGLLLAGLEPDQAIPPSLLLGIFFTLMDIYLELKRRK